VSAIPGGGGGGGRDGVKFWLQETMACKDMTPQILDLVNIASNFLCRSREEINGVSYALQFRLAA